MELCSFLLGLVVFLSILFLLEDFVSCYSEHSMHILDELFDLLKIITY